MPMQFVPMTDPEKTFDFEATPDTGAMISLISEDLVHKFNLTPDKNNTIRINAAN